MFDFFKKIFETKPKLEIKDKKKVELNFWVDRSWRTSQTSILKTCKQLNVARLGLFVNGLETHPFKVGNNFYRPFESDLRMCKDIEVYLNNGIKVDLTTWIYPHKKYAQEMLDYTLGIIGKFGRGDVRLDLDSESCWSTKFGNSDSRKEVSKIIYDRIEPKLVSINDYCTLQNQTESLIVPGCRIRPQAYSVGWVVRGGEKVYTKPNSIYYPGNTQKVSMGKNYWGQYKDSNILEFGLSAYKPVQGLTIQQQVRLQISEALKYNPTEIWFWQWNGLSTDYINSIKTTFDTIK